MSMNNACNFLYSVGGAKTVANYKHVDELSTRAFIFPCFRSPITKLESTKSFRLTFIRLTAWCETFGYFCSKGSYKRQHEEVFFFKYGSWTSVWLFLWKNLKCVKSRGVQVCPDVSLTFSCGSGMETPQKNWLLLKTCWCRGISSPAEGDQQQSPRQKWFSLQHFNKRTLGGGGWGGQVPVYAFQNKIWKSCITDMFLSPAW